MEEMRKSHERIEERLIQGKRFKKIFENLIELERTQSKVQIIENIYSTFHHSNRKADEIVT
jgi:hypothetical protein